MLPEFIKDKAWKRQSSLWEGTSATIQALMMNITKAKLPGILHTPQGQLKAAPSQPNQVISKIPSNPNYLLYDSMTHSLTTKPKVQTQLLGEVTLILGLCTSLQHSPECLLEPGGIHHLHSLAVNNNQARGKRGKKTPYARPSCLRPLNRYFSAHL